MSQSGDAFFILLLVVAEFGSKGTLGATGVPESEAAAARMEYALSESAAGDQPNARRDVDAAIATLTGLTAQDPEQLTTAFVAKARIELAQHDPAIGCAVARQALSLRPPDDPRTGWRHAEAQGVYGECLAERRQYVSARYQLQAALITLQSVRCADHWMTRRVRARLRALLPRRRFDGQTVSRVTLERRISSDSSSDS